MINIKTLPLTSEPPRPSEGNAASNGKASVTEIALDSLTATQDLLILTTTSAYRFVVTDPAQRVGVLIGGVLAGRRAIAFLAGAQTGRSCTEAGIARLRVGANAVFFLRLESGIKRVITSRITGLVRQSRPDGACQVPFAPLPQQPSA